MFERFKKFLLIVILSLLFLGTGYTMAFATLITVNSIEDAGRDYGEGAYARFVDKNNTLFPVLPTDPQFHSASDAYDYALTAGITTDWSLQSAGNLWAAPGHLTVGKSLSGLQAGTYRITPTGGGFTYDSWDWSDLYGKYLWKLYILADINGQSPPSFFTLGSDDFKGTAGEAFDLVRNQYLDITLADGGSLNFWIYDVNSVDNAGSLSFSVTGVPEPSTLLLLILGLPVLFRRIRS